MAQAAAILTFTTEGHKADERMVYYFVGIDNARFKTVYVFLFGIHVLRNLFHRFRSLPPVGQLTQLGVSIRERGSASA